MKLSAVAEPKSSSEPRFARISSPERRIPRRTSGCSTVFSTATNSATSTPEITKAPSVRSDVQPADGASTIAQTNTRNAPVTVSAPATSTRRLRVARDRVGTDDAQRGEQQDERDRGDDGERVAPAQLRQQPAGDEAEGEAGRGSGGVETERPVAAVTLPERGREDRERGRCRERCRHALDEAGGDQQRPVGGDGAEDGRGDERDQAPDEHALAAEDVGAAAAEEQEPAVAEHERRDDPLQLALGQVQRGADRGQRDLDERQVEGVEEDDPAEHDEQQLLVPRPRGRVVEVLRCDLQAVPPKWIASIRFEGHE